MRSHRLLEQLDEARGLFQSANVHEQHEIEAIRTELRLRGLFSCQSQSNKGPNTRGKWGPLRLVFCGALAGVLVI